MYFKMKLSLRNQNVIDEVYSRRKFLHKQKYFAKP